jgi:type II secretory pathway component PulL
MGPPECEGGMLVRQSHYVGANHIMFVLMCVLAGNDRNHRRVTSSWCTVRSVIVPILSILATYLLSITLNCYI